MYLAADVDEQGNVPVKVGLSVCGAYIKELHALRCFLEMFLKTTGNHNYSSQP
jgi:hypothetical protein